MTPRGGQGLGEWGRCCPLGGFPAPHADRAAAFGSCRRCRAAASSATRRSGRERRCQSLPPPCTSASWKGTTTTHVSVQKAAAGAGGPAPSGLPRWAEQGLGFPFVNSVTASPPAVTKKKKRAGVLSSLCKQHRCFASCSNQKAAPSLPVLCSNPGKLSLPSRPVQGLPRTLPCSVRARS